MQHSIIIYKKLKKPNKEGSYRYTIVSRYILTEEDICNNETEKYCNDEDFLDKEYSYFAEIEETNHS